MYTFGVPFADVKAALWQYNERLLRRLIALGLSSFLFIVPYCAWSDFVVINLEDSGPGSLRAAINDANANGGGTVRFSNVTGRIILSTTLPDITSSMAIIGAGTNEMTIDGNAACRILNISVSGSATISGLVISNGWVQANGAGILNEGSLTLSNCVVISNRQATSTSSLPVYSSSLGGGIFSSGSLSILRSAVVGNSALGYGGGIYIAQGSADLEFHDYRQLFDATQYG